MKALVIEALDKCGFREIDDVRPGEGDLHHDERSSNALADGYKVRGLPSGTQRTRIQGIASASVLCIMPAWSEPRSQWASSL